MYPGLKIVESVWLTESGPPVQVRRSWRERLLTRPWRPWQTTRTVIPQIPRKDGLICGDSIIMHPATAAELKRQLRAQTAQEK